MRAILSIEAQLSEASHHPRCAIEKMQQAKARCTRVAPPGQTGLVLKILGYGIPKTNYLKDAQKRDVHACGCRISWRSQGGCGQPSGTDRTGWRGMSVFQRSSWHRDRSSSILVVWPCRAHRLCTDDVCLTGVSHRRISQACLTGMCAEQP